MLQHIHYFLAGIFPNTINSRLYLEILSEPHLSNKQKLFSKSQFSPNFHDLATRADPSLGLLIPISQHFVRLLPMKADSQLENNSALPKGSISKRGQKICFSPQECCQDRLLCSDSDQLCYFDILISRRSLADRPRVHIGVSPFYAWSINSGSKTRRTSTITSTSN